MRFLTNRSSGRIGYALAEAAARRGAEVTLVSGPVALECPTGVRREFVESTQDLYCAMERLCREQDVIIQAAAPADYRPAHIAGQKIRRPMGKLWAEARGKSGRCRDGRQQKALRSGAGRLCRRNAESERKCGQRVDKKNVDFIVGNDVTRPGAGFDVDTNIITIFDRSGATELPMMKKDRVADKILDHVLKFF